MIYWLLTRATWKDPVLDLVHIMMTFFLKIQIALALVLVREDFLFMLLKSGMPYLMHLDPLRLLIVSRDL